MKNIQENQNNKRERDATAKNGAAPIGRDEFINRADHFLRTGHRFTKFARDGKLAQKVRVVRHFLLEFFALRRRQFAVQVIKEFLRRMVTPESVTRNNRVRNRELVGKLPLLSCRASRRHLFLPAVIRDFSTALEMNGNRPWGCSLPSWK